jgi:hypothetical protein
MGDCRISASSARKDRGALLVADSAPESGRKMACIYDSLSKDTPNRRPNRAKANDSATLISQPRVGGLHLGSLVRPNVFRHLGIFFPALLGNFQSALLGILDLR